MASTGLAVVSIIKRKGGPSIIGSCWCSHVLKVEDAFIKLEQEVFKLCTICLWAEMVVM